MSKSVTVRMDEREVEGMEAVRDRERFPTQSDFIREAVRRMTREERRNRARAECKALAARQLEDPVAREWAEASGESLAERLAKAEESR